MLTIFKNSFFYSVVMFLKDCQHCQSRPQCSLSIHTPIPIQLLRSAEARPSHSKNSSHSKPSAYYDLCNRPFGTGPLKPHLCVFVSLRFCVEFLSKKLWQTESFPSSPPLFSLLSPSSSPLSPLPFLSAPSASSAFNFFLQISPNYTKLLHISLFIVIAK